MLAAMLAAILDFSACHHLCQFMQAVSETTDNRELFIYDIMLYVGWGWGWSWLPLERVASFTHCHPTIDIKGFEQTALTCLHNE